MYEFKTEGMTCRSCVAVITKAVKEVDPRARVAVDLNTQKVTVESEQGQAELIHAIEEAGYPVKKEETII